MSSWLEEAEMEYRADVDDAWYSVRVVAEENGDVLRVKFCGFSEECDKVLRGSELKSKRDIHNLSERFRPISVQLQDSDCSKVSVGDIVCASFAFREDDIRFYDALVDGVENHAHARKEGGEEECLCNFFLIWMHGPNAENLSSTTIENICQVQSCKQIDPKLDCFLKRAGERFVMTSDPDLISKGDSSPNVKLKRSFPQFANQDTRCAKRSVSKICSSEAERIGSHSDSSILDMDFGGGGNEYVILLENLDKGSSPSMIAEFIQRATSVSPEVYIFPNISSEKSTRGVLSLDSKKEFQKLIDFLDSPKHIIMSSGGRPWVIVEKMTRHNPLRASTGIQSQRTLQNMSFGSSKGIKVVHVGTEEHKMAKLLKDLYVEFFNHQKRLREKLDLDVENILLLHQAL
ncbi:uncharacterized protein LOC115983562 isoform X1 [Quercus lobata]|uniref:uncharacterized protein LOC115983562 isoform X1 n=1 Tax=Quercus lobata TaxID=97700 RepID=UPI0012480B4B|nr:uncharacterized protein LOC115983562 isoform X1 [Quercus lobata]